jgi:MscS family membrane protein
MNTDWQMTFGLDRVDALQGELGGYPLWQYLASLIWIFCAFATAAAVDFILTRWIKRLTARTETDLDDKLLEILHKPVKVVITLLMLNVGVHAFTWPAGVEKWLSFGVGVLVGVGVIHVIVQAVDLLVIRWIQKLTEKTETDFDDKLIGILHNPLKVAVALLLVNAGLHIYAIPDNVQKIVSSVFAVAVAITLIYVAVRLVDLLGIYLDQKYADDPQLAKLMVPVMGKTLKVFVIIIGALTAAQFMGWPVTSVIAGLGIGGVAVALAAQNTFANIIGTITLLADRPMRVGDFIKVDGQEGNVEAIGLRSTRVRTLEGHLVTIPNKIMADSPIVNISRRPTIRHTMTISLTYGTPAARVQEAIQILREVFNTHPLTHEVIITWRDYAASSLDICVIYWCKSTDYKLFLGALEEINVEIKKRFDAAKLEFAFPTQTIQLQPPATTG